MCSIRANNRFRIIFVYNDNILKTKDLKSLLMVVDSYLGKYYEYFKFRDASNV